MLQDLKLLHLYKHLDNLVELGICPLNLTLYQKLEDVEDNSTHLKTN